eukprot:5568060-Amphidinium_carterae.1
MPAPAHPLLRESKATCAVAKPCKQKSWTEKREKHPACPRVGILLADLWSWPVARALQFDCHSFGWPWHENITGKSPQKLDSGAACLYQGHPLCFWITSLRFNRETVVACNGASLSTKLRFARLQALEGRTSEHWEFEL